MTKDWNYWRQRHITFMHDLTCDAFNTIHETSMTPIESIAYLAIKKVQRLYGAYYFGCVPQVPIDNYKVDFVVYFQLPGQKEKRIVIECDGHEFHEKTKEQASKDKKRDRELQKKDYVVFRYSGSDIVNDPSMIMRDIASVIGEPEWVTNDGVHQRPSQGT